jgi:hypothetical protein
LQRLVLAAAVNFLYYFVLHTSTPTINNPFQTSSVHTPWKKNWQKTEHHSSTTANITTSSRLHYHTITQSQPKSQRQRGEISGRLSSGEMLI